jgi:hypothetical protein
MGRLVPDMYDLNLSRAKDRVLAQAVREVTHERANDPSKCPVKRGSADGKSSPMRCFESGTYDRISRNDGRVVRHCGRRTENTGFIHDSRSKQ